MKIVNLREHNGGGKAFQKLRHKRFIFSHLKYQYQSLCQGIITYSRTEVYA